MASRRGSTTSIAWLKESDPDIACLQEIKSVDEGFPRLELEALGYHVETHGQKGFNGVAILSRQSPEEVNRGLPGDDTDEQARFIEAVFSTDQRAFCAWSRSTCPTAIRSRPKSFPTNSRWMERLQGIRPGAPGAGRTFGARRRLQRHPRARRLPRSQGVGGRRAVFLPESRDGLPAAGEPWLDRCAARHQ
jgi:hypothetical protein